MEEVDPAAAVAVDDSGESSLPEPEMLPAPEPSPDLPAPDVTASEDTEPESAADLADAEETAEAMEDQSAASGSRDDTESPPATKIVIEDSEGPPLPPGNA